MLLMLCVAGISRGDLCCRTMIGMMALMGLLFMMLMLLMLHLMRLHCRCMMLYRLLLRRRAGLQHGGEALDGNRQRQQPEQEEFCAQHHGRQYRPGPSLQSTCTAGLRPRPCDRASRAPGAGR